MTTNLKFISWNVNSIRALMKKQDLDDYLKRLRPHFFSITETKLSQPDEVAIADIAKKVSGYEYRYFNTSSCRKGYSGVAVFCKIEPLTVTEGIGSDEFDAEGRALTLEFEEFYLVNVYVPNSGEELKRIDKRINDWDRTLESHVIKLQKKKPVILTGDLNCARLEIDVHDPKSCVKLAGFTPKERDSFETLMSNTNLVDTYRYKYPSKKNIYTYWSYRRSSRARNKGWRIDYFLVSKSLVSSIKTAKIYNDVEGSDHCPVGLILSI